MFENLNFTQFLLVFLVLQIVYVVLNTITNITKIKCGKIVAATTSAICYGFYTIVVVATASNQPIWLKILLTAITNIVGVYIGMLIMEKIRKDKLWKIEATIRDKAEIDIVAQKLNDNHISFNIMYCTNSNASFNIYSKSQKESAVIKEILNECKTVKYIIHQSDLRL